MFTFDHIAIAAETLAEGVEYVEDMLGVSMAAGGEHPLMGTHNRLLGLADGLYMEVISINPDVPNPDRRRWFDLDNFKGQPRVTNWILRCDDLAAGIDAAPKESGVPISLSRADLRWQMAVPDTGKLPFDNCSPALIAWDGAAHPAQRLPASGLRLSNFEIHHPQAIELEDYFINTVGPKLQFQADDPGFIAHFDTPQGVKVLR
ncbi:VOC family protein [Halocynthiibacter namhaensis]|uniref:VOC family protein n=1 Tax=Halocynthiibacter namhaensis TaxID=1290553 RepID=UPI0005798273|nr:VOC family protein [Halocynthiibacter namhaensis]